MEGVGPQTLATCCTEGLNTGQSLLLCFEASSLREPLGGRSDRNPGGAPSNAEKQGQRACSVVTRVLQDVSWPRVEGALAFAMFCEGAGAAPSYGG